MRTPAARGSLRARAARLFAEQTVRPLAAALPVNTATLPVARLVIDAAMRIVGPSLPGTVVHRRDHDGVRGEFVTGPKAMRTDAVILYVHGGGFVAGSVAAYRGVASRLSTATRTPVFVVDYRLAPEHPSPCAQLDVARAYRWLLGRGYAPDRIVVAGDSAGGFLAADLVVTTAGRRGPAPAGLVLFSPMADLGLRIAHTGDRNRDGVISYALSLKAVAHFTSEQLELRPEHGTNLPPTLIQTGGAEYFAADAIELAARLRRAGAACELQVWADQMHVFQVMPALAPEARFAFGAAGRFVTSLLDTEAATAV
ncbi:alpha/beta hydrolase [Nocardia sp. NPDC059177]|uniref:alpha/beta hydrolase n=1 Tax=Nocardia sp. NPDC059177 TaxID=3346759 RepID=UPI0036A7FF94